VASEPLVTVVETPEFIRRIEKLMDDDERAALILYLAENPTAGVLIPGTGGVRKLRWGLEGRGKRGGARIIHFFHSSSLPLFLLTAFAKNERTDISGADRNSFRELTKLLVDTYGRR
jgi:hypothetical protein